LETLLLDTCADRLAPAAERQTEGPATGNA
jgi:hypothetical protein